jgi:hypothetical protein
MSLACDKLLRVSYLGYSSHPKDRGDVFLRNVGGLRTDYTALHLRK